MYQQFEKLSLRVDTLSFILMTILLSTLFALLGVFAAIVQNLDSISTRLVVGLIILRAGHLAFGLIYMMILKTQERLNVLKKENPQVWRQYRQNSNKAGGDKKTSTAQKTVAFKEEAITMAYSHEDSPPMSTAQQRAFLYLSDALSKMTAADREILENAYLRGNITDEAELLAAVDRLWRVTGVSKIDFDAFWAAQRSTRELTANMTMEIPTDEESEAPR